MSLIDDFTCEPEGGKWTRLLVGIGIASLPFFFGIYGLIYGASLLFDKGGTVIVFDGPSGIGLSLAYIAIGTAVHVHYFWGLSENHWHLRKPLIIASLLVFLPSFITALYLRFSW